MILKTILKKCNYKMRVSNLINFNVCGISTDSNSVKDNYIFGAIKGSKFNGEKFIPKLLNLKNIAIIVSNKSKIDLDSKRSENVTLIKVDDVRFFISLIVSIYYPNSISKKYAITGTNGKTSVAIYVKQIWEILGFNSASVGTLGVDYKRNFSYKTSLTTPDAIDNHKILNKLTKLGCSRIIFEASSIGLDQKRLVPLKFDVVGFTNLSRDHLDYHRTMRQYMSSKLLLFSDHIKKKSIAVINSDTKYSDYFLKMCKKHNLECLDYGKNAEFLKLISIHRINNQFEIKLSLKKKTKKVLAKCSSEYEIYNKICALVMVFNRKLKLENFGLLSKLKNPKGRLEQIYNKKKIRVFVDYAHTPQALSQVLFSLKRITKGKLCVVFGCGGNRDKSKRSLMTEEAIRYSDKVIITDDNPRFEDPKKIISDMIQGVEKNKLQKINIIEDRSKAIKFAINLLDQNDVLLIAGKGHENYQIIKNKKLFFCDKTEAKKFLNSL